MKGFTYGFHLGCSFLLRSNISRNHKSALDHPSVIQTYILWRYIFHIVKVDFKCFILHISSFFLLLMNIETTKKSLSKRYTYYTPPWTKFWEGGYIEITLSVRLFVCAIKRILGGKMFVSPQLKSWHNFGAQLLIFQLNFNQRSQTCKCLHWEIT